MLERAVSRTSLQRKLTVSSLTRHQRISEHQNICIEGFDGLGIRHAREDLERRAKDQSICTKGFGLRRIILFTSRSSSAE